MYKQTDLSKNIPTNDQEAWLKYPKLNWLYDTSKLLDYQRIPWYPFEIENLTTVCLAMHTLNQSVIEVNNPHNTNVYLEDDLNIQHNSVRNKLDLIIYKGAIVYEIFYTESVDGDIEVQKNRHAGELELKISALLALQLQKFCGVVSIEYVRNIIFATKLRPHSKAEEFYPHVVYKKLKALYSRRQWTTIPEIEMSE